MYESNLLPSRQPNTKKKLPNLGVPAPKQSVCLSLLCPALFFSFQRKSFFLKKRFQHIGLNQKQLSLSPPANLAQKWYFRFSPLLFLAPFVFSELVADIRLL